MEYVLIYANPLEANFTHKVLLVEKSKPIWQKGLFNLPGGKIEEGESIEEASIRELKEETGLDPLAGFDIIGDIEVCGKILDNDVVVHCVKVDVSFQEEIVSEEGQPAKWYDWSEIRQKNKLIPNLNVIIPLMMKGVVGWTIEDNDRPVIMNSSLLHRFKIVLEY